MFSGRVGIDPHSLKVLLVAFTSSAAFNIHGTTIHHAFRIPFGGKLLPYKRLPAEERSKMRDVFMDLLCLIIDEISMTGATLLYYLHRQLQDVFENNQPFGGIPVLTCGDLYQLKPVSDGYCFQGIKVQDSSGQAFAVSNIWIESFEMYELTTILRQQHGLPFAEALNRLRTGDHTPADLQLLKQFEIDIMDPPRAYSLFDRHIFATHCQLDAHNDRVLEAIVSREIAVESKDSVICSYTHEKDRQFFLHKAKTMDDSKTATLLTVLHLKVGIILEITTNVDILDGLYNGAWGFLRCTDPSDTNFPDILWIEFANASIGRRMRAVHLKLYEHGADLRSSNTPVFRLSRPFKTTSRPESTILR
jgi:ATP-dependent DNA helicase PIF1